MVDDTLQRDMAAALSPHRPGTLSCGWGSDATDNRPCKEPGCKRAAQFHFAGYCSNCAVKHNIPLVTVTSAAAEQDEQELSSGK